MGNLTDQSLALDKGSCICMYIVHSSRLFCD